MSSENDNNTPENEAARDSEKPAQQEQARTPEVTEKKKSDKPESEKTSALASQSSVTDKKVKPGKSAEKKQPVAKSEKSGGGLFKVLFFVLLLVVLGVGGYGGYWLYQHRDFFEQDFATDLEQQRELIAGIQRGLEKEREERIRLNSQLDNQLAAINNGLVSQSNRLNELGGTSRSDWLLAEAEFLMRLAHERLAVERDPTNALALLESADKILLDLDDFELLSVRKVVAKDITALRMVRRVDTQGIYLQLTAIAEQVASLPLSPVHAISDEQQHPYVRELEADIPWYKNLWHNFKHAAVNLRSLVRIQHHSQPVKALLAPEQEGLIRARLLVVMEQAQAGLLRGDATVYGASLQKARQLLEDYFQLTDGAAGLSGQLEELSQQSLVEVYPDISGSLRALQAYIDQSHTRYPVQQESDQ